MRPACRQARPECPPAPPIRQIPGGYRTTRSVSPPTQTEERCASCRHAPSSPPTGRTRLRQARRGSAARRGFWQRRLPPASAGRPHRGATRSPSGTRPVREQAPAGVVTSRAPNNRRSEEHTSELQSPCNIVCRLLLDKKKTQSISHQQQKARIARDLPTSYAVLT